MLMLIRAVCPLILQALVVKVSSATAADSSGALCKNGVRPYYGFGSKFPYQCKFECPQKYNCEAATNKPEVNVCCPQQQAVKNHQNSGTAAVRESGKTGNFGKGGNSAKTRADPGTPVQGTCPMGRKPLQACSGTGCPSGYICTKTQGSLSAVCCPNFGLCSNFATPYGVHSQVPVTCTIGQACPKPYYKCENSTTGQPVCCPNFGLCVHDSSPPYIQPGQTAPIYCGDGSSAFCPSTHSCVRSTTQIDVCCPSYGKCPGTSKPFVDQIATVPQFCNLNHPKGLCPGNYTCETSSTGWEICCSTDGSPPKQTGFGFDDDDDDDEVIVPTKPKTDMICPSSGAKAYVKPGQTESVCVHGKPCHEGHDAFHCETASGSSICCPLYGFCPGGKIAPSKSLTTKEVLVCPDVDIPGGVKQGICAKGESCEESTTGWVVCCPTIKLCRGGTNPYIPDGQTKPVSCSLAKMRTDPSQCPIADRRYVCSQTIDLDDDDDEGLCCPELGECRHPKIAEIDISQQRPVKCTIKTSATDCEAGATCETSTTGDLICCKDRNQNP